MSEETVRAIGGVLLILTVILANAFCVIYHIVAKWWKSEVGRHIMQSSAAMSILVDLWLVGFFFGGRNMPFRIAMTIAFAGIPVMFARQIWILLKIQRSNYPKVSHPRKEGTKMIIPDPVPASLPDDDDIEHGHEYGYLLDGEIAPEEDDE